MVIEVKVLSTFGRYVPVQDKRLEKNKWDVPEGAKVADVLTILKIPEEQDKILLVNGRSADGEAELCEGDILQVFPAIYGG